MNDKFDDTLFSILKETKTLTNFLDTVFGFLYRRTDFYHISNDSNLGVGLPEGFAECLLYKGYKKYELKQKIFVDQDSSPSTQTYNASNSSSKSENVTENAQENVKSYEPENVKSYEPENVQEEVEVENAQENVESSQPESVQEKAQTHLETYNGAAYENYSWSQTITDIDLQVKLPEKVSSKQLVVNITSSSICVKLNNVDTIYLEGEFCKKCKREETMWFFDGLLLQIHLEKSAEDWWDCLLKSEPRLDLNKMDCSRPFYELSDEAQAKIEEMTWNQERKRLGLPTSDQLELEKTLKQAWNLEGSPFTGEYDPSKVSLN